jgi:outer membrane protein, multidrug efflux system
LRAAGLATRTTHWSLGPSASATLWDGGGGLAGAQAARARYTQALAQLNSSLRSAVREVENALARSASAEQRQVSALEGLAASQELLKSSEAAQRAGRMSSFELEDARRAFNNATNALIQAQRDRAQAWVAVVKASGNGAAFSTTVSTPDKSSPAPT